MRMILRDYPDCTATIEVLSAENARRDLYRQGKGDGGHPKTFQFELRARKYPEWFELLDSDRIRYIGP